MGSILVVEDEELILNFIVEVLSKAGHMVESAIDGREGIQKFDNGVFDLVITDICMPVMNGNGVVKHIQSSKKKNIPVLGISGTPFYLHDTLFNATLPKPLRIKIFLQTVDDLLNFPNRP